MRLLDALFKRGLVYIDDRASAAPIALGLERAAIVAYGTQNVTTAFRALDDAT